MMHRRPTSARGRSGPGIMVVLAILFGVACPAFAAADDDALVAAGRRLYRDGIGVSGQPVGATTASGARVPAPQSNCVTCHRPSGFGTSEGGIYVPPITGPLVFAPRQLDRNRLFSGMFQQVQPPAYNNRMHQPHMRPAYTAETLARLLRHGQDAAGVALIPAMPRYNVQDADVAALAAYLGTLSAQPDPGVDGQTIHFATIVTDRTPAADRKVMLDTINAYFEWVNRHTEGDRSRPNFSPLYRSDFVASYRTWKLHVWELRGAEETWPSQLHDLYTAEPVFAVISGTVPGRWDEVGQFCDAQRLPCLFPLTDLPELATSAAGYSLHYTEGLRLEARAMAAFLAAEGGDGAVVQIVGPGPRAAVPAQVFAAEIARLRPTTSPRIIPVADAGGWSGAIGAVGAQTGSNDLLVIWPGETPDGENPDAAVAELQRQQPKARMILLPSQVLSRASETLRGEIAGRVRVIVPTDAASEYNPHSFRARGWMHARGIAADPPDQQYKVYWALTLLSAALEHLQQDFYRDYLIERLEHSAETNVNPGPYPALSLGPGQRFASRGVFVVRLDHDAPNGVSPVSDWIVP